MKSFLRHHFIEGYSLNPVLILLLIIGLFQSAFTNIGYDEAYYWRFAQELDWGYFDHPPMVALMIAIGNSILPGTIGIRLLTILLSLLTYYIIWLLIPEESRKQKASVLIFLLLILSNPLLNVYSFITTPDVPLIFFTALFFFVIRKFESTKNLVNALLLGLVMSTLIYSKYHGLLVILVVVFSKPKLFSSPLFYLASVFGALLYFPHLWWQYQNDFISFEYHLFYRSVLFNVNNVFNYILNIFLVFNPLLFPLFLIIYFKFGIKSVIHNYTYSIFIWFFILFFGFTAFRGHVEPQWIVVGVIPMTIYFHQYLLHFTQFRKSFFILAGISAFLVLILRIILILPFNLVDEFHGRDKTFYKEIKDLADGKPVVFTNSYTEASRYSFYTNEPTFSYNFISFRKNQYDVWDFHEQFHSKEAFLVTFANLDRFDKAEMSNGEHIRYKVFENLPVVNNIKVEILDYEPVLNNNNLLHITFKVSNPYKNDIIFGDSQFKLKWMIYLFYPDKERAWGVEMKPASQLTLRAESHTIVEGNFPINFQAGIYTMGMHIWAKDLFPISVSKRTYPIVIE